MDSTEEDIVRADAGPAGLALLLEKQRLVAVEGPVREQFEGDLRALTEAEQDSKELKSAKRSLLFDRIIDERRAAVPGRPGDGRRRQPGVKDSADEAVTSRRRPRRSTRISSARRSPSTSGGRTAAAPRRSARSSARFGVSPRTHGSGLFTRGQTQILTLLTLGTAKEGQRIDDLSLETGSPLHAPLQLPALLGRGDRLHARPEAPRHRPRCARAAGARGGDPGAPRTSRTRSGSSRRRSSRTARRRWARSAARRWR